MDNITILIAVLLGFYLGKFKVVNKKAEEVIQLVKKRVKEKKEIKKQQEGSLVVSTDEVALERQQEREDLNRAETIDIKEITKNG